MSQFCPLHQSSANGGRQIFVTTLTVAFIIGLLSHDDDGVAERKFDVT